MVRSKVVRNPIGILFTQLGKEWLQMRHDVTRATRQSFKIALAKMPKLPSRDAEAAAGAVVGAECRKGPCRSLPHHLAHLAAANLATTRVRFRFRTTAPARFRRRLLLRFLLAFDIATARIR